MVFVGTGIAISGASARITASTPTIASISTPYKYDAAIDDVAYTITGTCPSDTAIEIYDGATKLGDATVTAGAFTFTYTWTAVDADVQLKAVGNVSGDSEIVPMVVSQSNKINKALTSHTKGGANAANWSVSSGQADPFGGTTAYKITVTTGFNGDLTLLSPSWTWTPDQENAGLAIWVGRPTGTNISMVRPWLRTGGELHAAYPLNGTPFIDCRDVFACRTAAFERDGIYWEKYAIMSLLDDDGDNENAYTSVQLRLYTSVFNEDTLLQNFTAGDSVHIMYDTTISTTIPFLTKDKLACSKRSVSAAGVELYWIRHPFRTTLADYLGNPTTTYCDVRVLRPDSWTEGVEYPVMWLPSPVFYSTYASTFDIMEEIAAAGYHNTCNCIFIMFDISGNGKDYLNDYSDGVSKLHEQLLVDVLMPKAQEFWGCSADPEKNTMGGWSKMGIGGTSFIFRRTEVGYVLIDDMPYDMAYGDNFSADSYGTEANFLLYNPKTIIGSARNALKTSNRIMLVGGYSFPTGMSNFASAMTTNGIQFTNLNYTETAHTWENIFDRIPDFMTFAGIA